MPKSRHLKPKQKSSQPSGSLFLNVPKELQRIAVLMAQGDFEQALSNLDDLAERAPHRADVFEAMLRLGMKTNNSAKQLEAILRLVELQPFTAAHHYNLFVVYLQNNFPALALKAGRNFLSRCPDSPLGKELPKPIQEVHDKLGEQPIVAQLAPGDWNEGLALHDQIVLEIAHEKYEAAIAHTEQMLELFPNFLPAHNNRAIAHWFMGENAASLADTQRALELDPTNIYARYHLVRLLRFENRMDEARAAAERLQAAPALEAAAVVKQVEAFVYLSDYATALELVTQAEARGLLASESAPAALLHYYAGVAAARLGDEKKARELLQKTHGHSLAARLAQQQLQDLDKPPGQRGNSGALTLDHWIPRRIVQEYMQLLDSAVRVANSSATKAVVQKYFARYPFLSKLIPTLLECGDHLTRELAQHLAQLADTPELWQVLKDFASSAHGPDQFRNQVLKALQSAGQYAKGQTVTFWSRGKATEIKIIRYTIDDEPYESLLAPNISQGMAEARLALKENDLQRAAEALQRALQVEPSSANLQYHLVLIYLNQARVTQARELAEKLAAQHPAFALPHCQLALIALANDRKDEAREHLKTLTVLEHFHHREYTQFCQIQVLYQILVEADHEAALDWFKMWEASQRNDSQMQAARKALENRLTSKQWARQTLAHFHE